MTRYFSCTKSHEIVDVDSAIFPSFDLKDSISFRGSAVSCAKRQDPQLNKIKQMKAVNDLFIRFNI